MKKCLSLILAVCFVVMLPIQAQARVLKNVNELERSKIPDCRGDAQKGIKINGYPIDFHNYELLDGKVSIRLPVLYDVPQEMKDQMVPYEQKPQFMACRYDDYDINVSLTYYEDAPMEADDLEVVMMWCISRWQKEELEMVTYNTLSETLGTTVCWIDYETYNSGIKVYCLKAFFVVDGKLADITFQCPFKFKDEWEPVAQTALPTIKVIPVEDRR